MSGSSTCGFRILFLLAFFAFFLSSQAIVPSSQTFKYFNQGDLGEYFVEYGADYRSLQIYTYPFTLCFYNTTPNAFMLGLRMGTSSSESVMRWVWEANRGHPVRENASLAFGKDGNLVLADVDGKIAWQTGTANKGVVGLKLLPNGNLVLHDKKGRSIWQSFDYPTDTLLVGQSLRSSGPTKLVSRLSDIEPANGPYSFVMEKKHWAMYYQSKNSQKPMLYFSTGDFGYYENTGLLSSLTFYCKPEYGANHAYELGLIYILADPSKPSDSILSRPKYNSTYSMLRVDMDGNLRIYTFGEYVDWGAWETTYILLDRNQGRMSECKLPKRCGALGICEDDQCVACPKPQGLQGWSRSCAPPVLPACKGGSGSGKVDYYKVDGVEHFTSEYNEGNGPTKLVECKNRCTKDCMCLGLFYREESSKCLLVSELGTLIKTSNSSHVGYIKMSQ